MIIGLAGKAQAGKDTIGKYLVEQHKFERLAFADKLKEAVAALFDIPREWVDEWKNNELRSLDKVEVICVVDGLSEYSMSWREFLQRFGTEMGREVFGPNFWVDQVFVDPETYYHAEAKYAGRKIVVTDVRFAGEAERIKSLGGYVVEVVRPSIESEDSHPSEVIDFPVDATLYNDASILTLYERVERVLNDILEAELANH